MDEKRCEWCGTLSPVDADKCTLCRIPFGVPVPPPQDWSHLTGNIPVITAPLLETTTPPPADVAAVAPAAPVASSASPAAAQAPTAASVIDAPAAFVQHPEPVVPPQRVAVEALTPTAVPPSGEGAEEDSDQLPGWRAPDDPTLRLFADRLEERERRRRGAARASARRGRTRRRLARLLIWLVGLGLILAFVLLAPARLPGF